MARPNPRIDVIKHVGKRIAFSVNDRLAIEAKYGHKLTSEQWQQITGVTSVLTMFIPGINVATRARLGLSKFKKLEAAAKSLRIEFNENSGQREFHAAGNLLGLFCSSAATPKTGRGVSISRRDPRGCS